MKFYKILIAMMAFSLIFTACATESSPDGEFDEFASAEKADALWAECETRQVLAWLNDPTTSAQTLKDSGVHTRASNNIIKYRNGTDEVAGTDDDQLFDTLKELDDVSWVGKVAFAALLEAVKHRCQTESQAFAYFAPTGYDESYVKRVVDLIKATDTSIDVAMYSFRETVVLNALEDAIDRGVKVRFIFESANDHRKDPEGTMSSKLEDRGIDVRYINKIMHHKYAIFDGPIQTVDSATSATLVSGSGNWSSAAYRYDENMIEVKGNAELVLRYQKEFNYLWNNSRDFVWDDSFEQVYSLEISEGMIADDFNVDAVFTSGNFKTSISSRYGPTFSIVRGVSTVSDKLVEIILSAKESILSRPRSISSKNGRSSTPCWR